MYNEFSGKKIALTGYSGFIGSRLVKQLAGNSVLLLGRSAPPDAACGQHHFLSLEEKFDVENILKGVDVVIHAAANPDSMANKITELNQFKAINANATKRLVTQAAKAGVKRFIFISSIKVNGESTKKNEFFNNTSVPNPSDQYGFSKFEGEIALRNISEKFGMEWVIIRPPLVYGPGVKGNFEKLISLASKRIPLPFSRVDNARSMVYLDNLVDLILCCVKSNKAINRVFLVSDNDDLSLKSIISILRFELNRSAMIFPFPISGFNMLASIFRKQEIFIRLFGNLQVDISYTMETLEWKPPFTVEEGLKHTMQDFLNRSKS